MSGDAQPRKRKDKKKKKEDSVEDDFFVPLKHSTDEVIHLHKDITCGGNVVTKLIFFGLMATIGVMVGFILLEYRGSTDEQTSSAVDSPWSVTFHDWVDVADTGHDHEDEHLIEEDDHVEEEHDIHDENEQDVHDEELHSYDEDEVEKKGSWLFNWISFGSVPDEESEDKVTEDDDAASAGIFSWFQSSEGEQNTDEVEESSSGGWFGFGNWQLDVEEKSPEAEYTSSEVNNKDEEQDEGSDEMRDDYEKDEEEEKETEEEEGEEIDEEEEEENNDDEEEEEEEEEEEQEKDEEEESEEEIDNVIDSAENDDKSEEIEEEQDENIKDEDNESEEINPESEEEENKFRVSNEVEDNDSKNFVDDDGNDSGENSEEKIEESKEDDEEPENVSFGLNKDERSEENNEEDDDQSNLFENDESEHMEKEGNEHDLELDPKHGNDENVSVEEKEENESSGDEELFPEAREALKREAEELENEAKELNVEEFSEKIEEIVESDKAEASNDENEETEGTGGEDEVAPSMESSELPSEVHVPVTETPVVTSAPVKTESAPFSKAPPQPEPEPPKLADEATLEEVSADEESPVEEGSPVEEEEEEEQEDEELEIDQQKFRDLLEKYGQETPESSDIEHTDDERVDYSEGDESPVEDQEEQEVASEDEAGSEDDLKEWTGIKKSDVQVETDSEDEEEEESEDEPPPPPPPPQPSIRKRGGQRDVDEDYVNTLITNDEDWTIREELDQADEEFNYEKARPLYRALLIKHPDSPRARYGLARTFDRQAEHERNNVMLDLAITGYKDALEAPDITDILFIQIASRLIDRLRFRGHHMKAVPVHNALIQKFNTTPEYRTDLAITYLMVNRLEDARLVLKELLRYWNQDPFALVHYGLVLKLQGNIHGCIKYFKEGLETAFKPFSDPRLYFHYGDALARVGRESDALKVYDLAVALGLFRSRYQRSLYNIDRLTARPWWTHEQTTYGSFFKLLESNWKRIRDEAAEAFKLNGLFKDEAEGLRDKGDWKQFELFARGSKMKKNCEITPFTCSLIGSFEPAATCKRGQSKFSIMDAGTHVWPHCGPTNCRLRAHLGLIVPQGPKIRVANITRTWEEGKVMVFDDSFEHEVWHEGSSLRLVLIVDVWHPELTIKEKLSLSPI